MSTDEPSNRFNRDKHESSSEWTSLLASQSVHSSSSHSDSDGKYSSLSRGSSESVSHSGSIDSGLSPSKTKSSLFGTGFILIKAMNGASIAFVPWILGCFGKNHIQISIILCILLMFLTYYSHIVIADCCQMLHKYDWIDIINITFGNSSAYRSKKNNTGGNNNNSTTNNNTQSSVNKKLRKQKQQKQLELRRKWLKFGMYSIEILILLCICMTFLYFICVYLSSAVLLISKFYSKKDDATMDFSEIFQPNDYPWYLSFEFVLCLILFVLLLPIILKRHLSAYQISSFVGIVAYISLIILIFKVYTTCKDYQLSSEWKNFYPHKGSFGSIDTSTETYNSNNNNNNNNKVYHQKNIEMHATDSNFQASEDNNELPVSTIVYNTFVLVPYISLIFFAHLLVPNLFNKCELRSLPSTPEQRSVNVNNRREIMIANQRLKLQSVTYKERLLWIFWMLLSIISFAAVLILNVTFGIYIDKLIDYTFGLPLDFIIGHDKKLYNHNNGGNASPRNMFKQMAHSMNFLQTFSYEMEILGDFESNPASKHLPYYNEIHEVGDSVMRAFVICELLFVVILITSFPIWFHSLKEIFVQLCFESSSLINIICCNMCPYFSRKQRRYLVTFGICIVLYIVCVLMWHLCQCNKNSLNVYQLVSYITFILAILCLLIIYIIPAMIHIRLLRYQKEYAQWLKRQNRINKRKNRLYTNQNTNTSRKNDNNNALDTTFDLDVNIKQHTQSPNSSLILSSLSNIFIRKKQKMEQTQVRQNEMVRHKIEHEQKQKQMFIERAINQQNQHPQTTVSITEPDSHFQNKLVGITPPKALSVGSINQPSQSNISRSRTGSRPTIDNTNENTNFGNEDNVNSNINNNNSNSNSNSNNNSKELNGINSSILGTLDGNMNLNLSNNSSGSGISNRHNRNKQIIVVKTPKNGGTQAMATLPSLTLPARATLGDVFKSSNNDQNGLLNIGIYSNSSNSNNGNNGNIGQETTNGDFSGGENNQNNGSSKGGIIDTRWSKRFRMTMGGASRGGFGGLGGGMGIGIMGGFGNNINNNSPRNDSARSMGTMSTPSFSIEPFRLNSDTSDNENKDNDIHREEGDSLLRNNNNNKNENKNLNEEKLFDEQGNVEINAERDSNKNSKMVHSHSTGDLTELQNNSREISRETGSISNAERDSCSPKNKASLNSKQHSIRGRSWSIGGITVNISPRVTPSTGLIENNRKSRERKNGQSKKKNRHKRHFKQHIVNMKPSSLAHSGIQGSLTPVSMSGPCHISGSINNVNDRKDTSMIYCDVGDVNSVSITKMEFDFDLRLSWIWNKQMVSILTLLDYMLITIGTVGLMATIVDFFFVE